MKKLLALLLLVTEVVSAQQTAGTVATATTPVLDPNQIYNTGNVVQMTTTTSGSTWVNGAYVNQLCFYAGEPGNCGPNPSVRPGNYINYSYGYTDLYQVQAISSILPQTGLRVNGYTFGFTAKNGNGWDDGRVDQLNAYVTFYGTDGKVKDYTNYDLNSKFNWTTFSYSKDFVTPYADKDLSTVRYGFTGKDNNFWAGNYGPEIMDVNFSLKYSVDACAVNVLSSPTCPGYTEALLKSIPTTTNTDTTTTVATAPPPPEAAAPPPPPPPPPPPSTANAGQPSVVAPVVSAPAPPPPGPGPAPATNASASSSQPTKETTGSGGGNVSLALSVISKNSERDAAGAAVAQSAVAQAQATANQAQQEAVSVAAQAVSNSVTAGQSALKTESGNSSSSKSASTASIQSDVLTQSVGQVNLVTGPTTSNNTSSSAQKQEEMNSPVTVVSNTQNTSTQTVQTILVSNNDSNRNTTTTTTAPVSTPLPMLPPQQNQVVASMPLPTNTAATQQTIQEQQPQVQSIYSLLPPQQPLAQTNAPQVATVDVSQQPATTLQQTTQVNNSEVVAMLSPNMLTDKTNPLTDIVEAKQNVPQSNTTAMTGPSVNRSAQNNEVAGGVDINKMALAPVGYGDYLNFAMKDVAFYAPKEVYKNQRNVDNARALRLMTNDSKHREMVEMQYAK